MIIIIIIASIIRIINILINIVVPRNMVLSEALADSRNKCLFFSQNSINHNKVTLCSCTLKHENMGVEVPMMMVITVMKTMVRMMTIRVTMLIMIIVAVMITMVIAMRVTKTKATIGFDISANAARERIQSQECSRTGPSTLPHT